MTPRSRHVRTTRQRGVRLPTPGARESNPGDAFHVLWAAPPALHLIAPRTRLKLVVMEGVTPTDGNAGDSDDLFLGVDISEYYEGTDLGSATGVIASQLKYRRVIPIGRGPQAA